jgi:hypothetical protein
VRIIHNGRAYNVPAFPEGSTGGLSPPEFVASTRCNGDDGDDDDDDDRRRSDYRRWSFRR